MQPWGMVQYPALTKPVFTEPEKLGMGGSDAVVVFEHKIVGQTFFFVGEETDTPPEADTDLLSKWFQPQSQPFPIPQYPVNEGAFEIDLSHLQDPETTFVSAWDGIYPNFHHVPQYHVYEGGIASGFQVATSADGPPVIHGDLSVVIFEPTIIFKAYTEDPAPVDPIPPPQNPEVTLDSWYQPPSEPVRTPPFEFFLMPAATDVLPGISPPREFGLGPSATVGRVPTSVKRARLAEVRRVPKIS